MERRQASPPPCLPRRRERFGGGKPRPQARMDNASAGVPPPSIGSGEEVAKSGMREANKTFSIRHSPLPVRRLQNSGATASRERGSLPIPVILRCSRTARASKDAAEAQPKSASRFWNIQRPSRLSPTWVAVALRGSPRSSRGSHLRVTERGAWGHRARIKIPP